MLTRMGQSALALQAHGPPVVCVLMLLLEEALRRMTPRSSFAYEEPLLATWNTVT